MSHYRRFHSVPHHCPPFHDIPTLSISFHSAKECYIYFQTIHDFVLCHFTCHSSPFHRILLHSPIPTSSTELHCDKVGTILMQATQGNPVVSVSTTFHSVPQHGTPLCNILPHSIAFYYVREGPTASKPLRNSLLRDLTRLST